MPAQRRRYSLTEADAETIKTAIGFFIGSFENDKDPWMVWQISNAQRILNNLTNYEWRKEK